MVKIGILDIQGSVEEHLAMLGRLGVEVVLVKEAGDLEGLDGLILPGGESTTIGKLLVRFGLKDAIVVRVSEGMAVWGTCAGAILLAREVSGGEVEGLKLMDICVERNAYGAQLDSFESSVVFGGAGFEKGKEMEVPAIFIRAPKILSVGKGVEILAKEGKAESGNIVAAKEGNMMVTTFHPELSEDLTVHQYFLKICGL